MPRLPKTAKRALEQRKGNIGDDIARFKLERKPDMAAIQRRQAQVRAIEEALRTGKINEVSKKTIQSAVVNIGDNVARSQMQLQAFKRQGMRKAEQEWERRRAGSHAMLSFKEYVASLQKAVRAGNRELKVLRNVLGRK